MKHKARSIYVPAGQTPIPVYQSWTLGQPEFLETMDLLQIDDVVTGSGKGLFGQFLAQHLPLHTSRLRLIEFADRVGDLALLGLGLNGHVAFHEPGLPREFFSGCVRLDRQTCESLKIEQGTWGVTYGTGAFLRSRAILMMVRGASKKSILRRLIEGDPTLPASSLLAHDDFTILADTDALS